MVCAKSQILPPWLADPYRLISWWKMEKFAAQKFCSITSALNGLASHYLLSRDSRSRISTEEASRVVNALTDIQKDCHDVGLQVTANQIEDACFQIPRLALVQVGQTLSCLSSALTSEMRTHLFMRIFPERTSFYEQENLFGTMVSANFPSAVRDIKSAGSCYATDCSTACVMHLMRTLEIGLCALAGDLNVSFARQDWEKVINNIEAEIKKQRGPQAGAQWKQKRDFYADAAKDFRYFKDAWRNHAMHAHEHYDAPEARSILDHIKAFMQHLAENGLKETIP